MNTTNEKINKYIELSEEIKKLEQQQKILKESIQLQMQSEGLVKMKTNTGIANIVKMERETVNKKLLKEILGEESQKFIKKTSMQFLNHIVNFYFSQNIVRLDKNIKENIDKIM